MKKFLALLFGFLIVTSFLTLEAQKLIKNSSVTGVCYAGNKIKKIYIPPPDEFYKKAGSKSGGSVKVNYTGFSSPAKVAVDYAASILESMLPPDTKVTVSAIWGNNLSPGTLGQTSIAGYIWGADIDALNPLAIYPVALAEKISGKSLSDSLQGDLRLTINGSITWYLGTDGNTPTSKYDLVTVAMHEICHGLGISDSFSTDGTLGWYGFESKLQYPDSIRIVTDTLPLIYDTFVESLDGKRLTDPLQFLNYSTGLKNQLTGNLIYFDGPVVSNYSNKYSVSRPRLWAPSVWDVGSSISHLDENVTPDSVALMTPIIDHGEAVHNPGKLTFSILGDLGWINTRIIHTPLGDTEKHLTEVELSAIIKSDTSYIRESVGVVFSFDKFRSSDTLYMTSPNSDDSYNARITIPSYNTDLQYYFFVKDYFLRLYRSPSLFGKIRYDDYIGVDTVKPVITHAPIDSFLETQMPDTLHFNAQATDNLGIDSVYVEYKVNTGPSRFLVLKAGKSDIYTAILNTKPELLIGGDSIQYRIFAVDTAMVPNTSVLPKKGYFVIHIEKILSTLESYLTDFSNAAADFYNSGFNIFKPAGFSKYGLNTKHPYESPEDNNKSIDYTAILGHPLKFDGSGMLINFNEIVLVEPGEPGSVFGSINFYDYVIVEGSKNFGKTWFSLADGYDSRLIPSWETAYNSSIVRDNSTFIPTESMLHKHTIFYSPSDKISAGDTLLLRFRLYSDPFANGWGWVIEDLKINPLIDAVEKIKNDEVKVYPNPGNGLINISTAGKGKETGKPLRFSIFNSAGICIINDKTYGDSGPLIDISGYPSGIYIIILYSDDGIRPIKYSLVK